MDRPILIDKIRRLQNRYDFLSLLNELKADLGGDNSFPFTSRQLGILCNPKYGSHRYRTFEIPKKTGGKRHIAVPCGTLKWFQRCLNEILKAVYTPSLYAMGFVEGRSIVDNARMHTNQNYVFNIDLKDFFTSIDQARVWKRLQLPPFSFNKEIASIMAGLCAIEHVEREKEPRYVLPQGAPTSPLLTNAICDTLDRRLQGLAKRFGLHYSRYADDITFSSMHNVYQAGSDFCRELQRVIAASNLEINPVKTRLCHRSQRQEVTGLTVGSKINVNRKYVKDLRAILHIWEKYGLSAAYASFYPYYRSEKCRINRGNPDLVKIISGKLCYLKMVKGENDPVYCKLLAQYRRLLATLPQPQQSQNIEYIFTMPKTEFEKRLGIGISFSKRAADEKIYGHFDYQNRRFIVAVSQYLDPTQLPPDTQISLTRMIIPGDNIRQRVGYLLHRPQGTLKVTVSLWEDIDLSDPNTKDNTMDSNSDILERLVRNNFDLSTLP